MATSVNPEGLFKLATGFWASKTLLCAVELGVFTELPSGRPIRDPRGSASGCTLARRAIFSTRSSRCVLDREDGDLRNTPETSLFLDREKPSYVGGILEMANARLYPILGSSHRSAEDGTAAKRGEGTAGRVSSGSTPIRAAEERSSPP